MSLKVYFYFLLIFPYAMPSVAQRENKELKNHWTIGTSASYGALLGYKDGHPPLIFTNPIGIEIFLTKLSSGKKKWEHLYNYPSVSYSVGYYNYGIPKEYGEAFSGTASYEFNILNNNKRRFWLSTGVGLVYSTKKFNAETNPDNKAISTDVSYVLQGGLRYDFNLSSRLLFNTSFAFKHFSNATIGVPNNGMNFPLLGVGLTYKLSETPTLNALDSTSSIDKKIHFTLSAGVAIKKVLKIDERHKIYTLSIFADKQITKYNSLIVGIDAFYNNSLASEYVKRGRFKDDAEIDHRQLAITAGQELFIGKIGIVTIAGFFLYQPHKFDGSFYQKYGVKYYFTKDVFLGSTVKVYTGTADFMEWSIGIKL